MSSSLFSAVSGLRNNQEWLDVIGNNIANSNTPGFKASQVVFQDILSQTLSAGAAPSTNLGGINPMQVGLGVHHRQHHAERSCRARSRRPTAITDMAIQGDGFFVVANGNDRFYTRAGAFTLDANGDLVEGSHRLQGPGRGRATSGSIWASRARRRRPPRRSSRAISTSRCRTATTHSGHVRRARTRWARRTRSPSPSRRTSPPRPASGTGRRRRPTRPSPA